MGGHWNGLRRSKDQRSCKKGEIDLWLRMILLVELAQKSKVFQLAENVTHYIDQPRISNGESDRRCINILLGEHEREKLS